MRKSTALLFVLLSAFCLLPPAYCQQVSIQGPVNNIQGVDAARPLMTFNPARSGQTGNQTEWRSPSFQLVTSVSPTGNITFGNCTSFQQTTGWGLNILPCVRPTGSQVYLFGLNDSGGQTSGLMSGNGAAVKTYAFGILVNRPNSADATGDSNDAIAKWSYNNYGQNDGNFILRGLNTVVNNRDAGTLGQLVGGLISASSKSGSVSPQVRGLEVNVENFGTNADEHSGIDVTLKNEGAKATLEYGVRVRNIDNSTANAADAAYMVSDSGTNTGFTYGFDSNGATLANENRFSNGMTLARSGANAWDGLTLTKTTATGPTVGNEGVGLFIQNNRTAAIDDQATVTGIEAVTRSRASGVNLTIRGGHFRTYVDDTLGGTAITSVGLDGSARASGAVVAAPGTAFVGIRSYMAPGFTGPTLANVTNFHAFWAYNESTTQAVTNAFYASAAAGGFTNGLNLSGTTIAATGGQVIFSNGVYLYTGAQTTRDTVRAEVGLGGAIGSTYFSTAGKIYLKVANADATTDWERVTTSAAD